MVCHSPSLVLRSLPPQSLLRYCSLPRPHGELRGFWEDQNSRFTTNLLCTFYKATTTYSILSLRQSPASDPAPQNEPRFLTRQLLAPFRSCVVFTSGCSTSVRGGVVGQESRPGEAQPATFSLIEPNPACRVELTFKSVRRTCKDRALKCQRIGGGVCVQNPYGVHSSCSPAAMLSTKV